MSRRPGEARVSHLTQEQDGAGDCSEGEGYAPAPDDATGAYVDGSGNYNPSDGAALHQRVEASPPPRRRHLTRVDKGTVVPKSHTDAPQDAADEQHRDCARRRCLQTQVGLQSRGPQMQELGVTMPMVMDMQDN